MSNKTIWQSKTFWVGAIEIAIGALQLVAKAIDDGTLSSASGWVLVVVGILTIALRVVTTGPVSLTVLLLALLFAIPAGAEAQTTDPAWASYRVRVRGAAGSSVGITPNIAVTNVHVVGNSRTARLIHAPTNREWTGSVVARDPNADVAFVYVASGDLDWVHLGDDPQAGQACSLYGYGGDDVLKTGRAQYVRIAGQRNGTPYWMALIESIPGDSGSGVFDDAGRLCSINWGTNQAAQSLSTPVSYVRRLFDRMNGQVAESRPAIRGGVVRKQPVTLRPKEPEVPAFDPDAFLNVLAGKLNR